MAGVNIRERHEFRLKEADCNNIYSKKKRERQIIGIAG
jgi:hypothetical protein